MKKIVWIVISVIIVIFILLNIFSITNTSLFGYRIYKVGSGSMEPTLKVNDLIIVKACDEYKEQDIVTYEVNKQIVTHRIISINDEFVTTQGDNNKVEDLPFKKDFIIGKMVLKLSLLPMIMAFIFNPLVWGSVIVCAILYIINDSRKAKH